MKGSCTTLALLFFLAGFGWEGPACPSLFYGNGSCCENCPMKELPQAGGSCCEEEAGRGMANVLKKEVKKPDLIAEALPSTSWIDWFHAFELTNHRPSKVFHVYLFEEHLLL